ncbi:MAG: class I SAM-dependent methyltransferase [Desulfomonile tiedjei]|nr:class I SAM-dependent methyltransferase [Desulfomonile tiedjei]
MTDRLKEGWRKLNAETIGTDAYWWIAVESATFYEDMKRVVEQYAYGRALDAGAGRLAWRELLSRHVGTYLSGDLNVEHDQLDVVFDLTARFPFPDGSFDTLFCCSVLEHAPEPWDAFSEMSRVLTRGGVAIVSLPFLLHLHDEPHDYYRFTRYGIEYLASKAGFEVKEVVVNGGLFHLVLNVPSIVLSIVWQALGARFLIRPTTRFWVALAKTFDRWSGLGDSFASNYIVILRKRDQ